MRVPSKTFYRNTRTRVIKSVYDEKLNIKNLIVVGVQDSDNKKHWTYFSYDTGLLLIEGTRKYCITWINDNAEKIKKLFERPAYKEYATDIEYAREAYDD